MSRQNPFGFGLSILFEIAAVVAIVSFLPRVDLRPTAAAEANYARAANMAPAIADPAFTRASWTAADSSIAPISARETSFYERPAARPLSSGQAVTPLTPPEAPPLIEANPARAQYVEQRLDRASQQLVNSVGSYVTQAAGNLANYQPAPPAQAFGTSQPPIGTYSSASAAATSFPTATPQPAPASPAASAPHRPAPAAYATQPRPWLRY